MTAWFVVVQRAGFLSPLFGGQSKALMWARGADKMPAGGCVFAHYWEELRKHMASLTTDEPSSFPLIAQETGQVHTVTPPPKKIPADRSGVVRLNHACNSTTQILKWFHLRRLGVHVEATVSKLWPEVNRAQGEFRRKLVNCPYTSLFPVVWCIPALTSHLWNCWTGSILSSLFIMLFSVWARHKEPGLSRRGNCLLLHRPLSSVLFVAPLIVSVPKGQRDQQLHMPSWTLWSRVKHLNNCCTEIHGPQRLKPYDFGDPLTFSYIVIWWTFIVLFFFQAYCWWANNWYNFFYSVYYNHTLCSLV